MLKQLYLLLFVLSVASQSETVFAQKLTALEIYKRCYIRMVRAVPDESDALYKAVENKTKTGPDACIELFDRAQFNTNGVMKKRSEDGKAILRTFHSLHGSWFQTKIVPYRSTASHLVRDSEEAWLYYTRAAFMPKAPFSSVVTLDHGLQGVRDQLSNDDPFLAQTIASYDQDMPYKDSKDLVIAYNKSMVNEKGVVKRINPPVAVILPDSKLPELGELVGVKPAFSLKMPDFINRDLGAEVTNSLVATMNKFDGNAHFGGGVIGSQAFVGANSNLTSGQVPESYERINRRLTARVFEDLLCHTLPTLGEADVEPVSGSTFVFQQQKSCMACHSSIDGMGFGYRHLVKYTSAPNPGSGQRVGLNFGGMFALTSVNGSKTFALQTPKGQLHFAQGLARKKKIVKKNFSSLKQLGEMLAESEDLYNCAAKRYYKFFTGVDVDLTKPANAKTDPLGKQHQDAVLKLGQQFKEHQSVRSLIYQIFSSAAFKSRNYLTETFE